MNHVADSLLQEGRTVPEAAPAPAPVRTGGVEGLVNDFASDQRAFKDVPWGKAMMWIFLLSDTFVFACFLVSYMTVRISTTEPWPDASIVFGLHVGETNVPLLL
ncbi:MAG: bb3-type cytochrome oxidase subunit IV, partial [Gammaproteobacteria bacterium]